MSIFGSNKKQSFGVFISTKRIEKGISLRQFAKSIQISPEYLSKIENELRAVPKDEIVKTIAEKLHLNSDEREILFDLAAESKPYVSLALDLVEYVKENEMVYKTLRIAKRYELKNEEWQYIFDYILKNHM